MYQTYYRVKFHGRNFKELNKREWIYKEPKGTFIAQFTERIKQVLSETFKISVESVQVYSNSCESFDESKIGFQVVAVEPFSENEVKDRGSSKSKSQLESSRGTSDK